MQSVERVTAAYTRYGASMISILTDSPSFGGSTDDLKRARFNNLPVLRKDFILDTYQTGRIARDGSGCYSSDSCLSPTWRNQILC